MATPDGSNGSKAYVRSRGAQRSGFYPSCVEHGGQNQLDETRRVHGVREFYRGDGVARSGNGRWCGVVIDRPHEPVHDQDVTKA